MQTFEQDIQTGNVIIHKTETSRLAQIDMDHIPFGRVFSDHMLLIYYRNGQWQTPEIRPYGKLELAPSVSVLNYGQSIFEGMKAHRGPMGKPLLFRPRDNWKRINHSAARMCMPALPEELFMDGLKALIELDQAWIPPTSKGALYIRPLMFATDEFIGVKPSEEYLFTIFTGPAGTYYSEPVSLLASKDYVRAGIGGTGSAKTAGNYASGMLPDRIAKSQGYHNVLWLDGREHRYVEECGTMNMFFVIDNTIITPPLAGTILPGITRDSVIRVLRDNGYRVEVRPIAIQEIESAYDQGYLQEAFGAGTAATIAHIARIGYGGRDLVLPPTDDRPVSNWLNETLYDIRVGNAKDPYGWVEAV
jgi:branched-chain amino acid aminotransferase